MHPLRPATQVFGIENFRGITARMHVLKDGELKANGSFSNLALGGSCILVFFCSSISVVLLDTLGISKCHKTLFMSSLHL